MKKAGQAEVYRRSLLCRAARATMFLITGTIAGPIMKNASAAASQAAERIPLPAPMLDPPLTVAAAIEARRSIRDFISGSIALEEISRILWAAQGITDQSGYRAAPSAGALYPLEVQLIAGDVDALPTGIYRYRARVHALDPVKSGDSRAAIARAAFGQSWIAEAAAILVIAAVAERTTAKYGARGNRYVHIEVGHAAQNVYLQAGALGLGTTIVGAFSDDAVKHLAHLRDEEDPLCLLPIGRH
jgi:SagB-type dehydrogenase family enzyme